MEDSQFSWKIMAQRMTQGTFHLDDFFEAASGIDEITCATVTMSAGPSNEDGASDVLLGQLLQHYVEDMTNFQVSRP